MAEQVRDSTRHLHWRNLDWELVTPVRLQIRRSCQSLPVARVDYHWQMRRSRDLKKGKQEKGIGCRFHHMLLNSAAWEPGLTWQIFSWQEWLDEMSIDCFLSFAVHEGLLTAECPNAKIEGKYIWHDKSCSSWSIFFNKKAINLSLYVLT